MHWRGIDREASALFYTFYELFSFIGLRRVAPLLAAALIVVVIGALLLLALNALAVAVGQVVELPFTHAPRSIAALGIFGGYMVWDKFASPDRIAFLEADHVDEPLTERRVRRGKVAIFALALAAMTAALT